MPSHSHLFIPSVFWKHVGLPSNLAIFKIYIAHPSIKLKCTWRNLLNDLPCTMGALAHEVKINSS